MAESDPTERAYLQARITATEASIAQLEAAIVAVAGGAQSYTLDTGQTRQTVTKANLTEVSKRLEALLNLRSILRLRLDGGGSLIGRGAF